MKKMKMWNIIKQIFTVSKMAEEMSSEELPRGKWLKGIIKCKLK